MGVNPQDRDADEYAQPRRHNDGTFVRGSGSANPGGQPKWVKRTRDALKDCAPLAVRHLERMLGAPAPVDESPAEAAIYAKASARDRNAAADMVLRYTLTLPKATVKHEGKGDTVVVEVKTYSPEEKS